MSCNGTSSVPVTETVFVFKIDVWIFMHRLLGCVVLPYCVTVDAA